MSEALALEEKIAEVSRRLRRRYGDFAHNNKRNPLSELLFILCTVKTQEKNYSRSYHALRKAFPTFWHLHVARKGEIAAAIKRGGLSNQRARSIKAITQDLAKRFGRPTLAPLCRMPDADCESLLLSLPSVGKKVARCVMMYSLGRKVFPVDTHCWRISRRLGFIRGKEGEFATDHDMDRLEARVPDRLRFSLHVNMVSFGRDICRAARPRCERCPLYDLCATAVRRGLAGARQDLRGLARGWLRNASGRRRRQA